jgi:hypothetical protein
MSYLGRASWARAAGTFVAAAAVAGLLTACSGGERLAVTGAVPPPAAPPAAASTFQGAVASVDAGAGTMVVAVQIVWRPTVEARSEDRRVIVDGTTAWGSTPLRLGDLHVGEQVQVDANPTPDGAWRAVRVQLFDID